MPLVKIWDVTRSARKMILINESDNFEDVINKGELVETVLEEKGDENRIRNQDIQLPVFSEYVINHLLNNKAQLVWSRLIHECADYYIIHFPNLSQSGDYLKIGEKLYGKYPAIKQVGMHPWSMFCKDLSQRLRWIRWNNKKKSLNKPTEVSNPKKFRLTPRKAIVTGESDVEGKNGSNEDYQANILGLELQKESEKRQPNQNTVKTLLTETHDLRTDWIKSLPDGSVKPIIEKFPCFQYGKDIVFEVSLVLGGSSHVQKIGERLNLLMEAVEKVMKDYKETDDGDSRLLRVLEYTQNNVSFEKGKGEKSQNIIVKKNDIDDEDREKSIWSKTLEAPKLIIFMENGKFSDASVATDTVEIYAQADTVLSSIIVLISVYYTFHLAYPRIYSQFLGFLQEYVMNQPYLGIKSKKYKLFAKKMNDILR